MSGKYRTIVADPPWEQPFGKGLSDLPFSTLALHEIEALPVSELAAPEAELYLWTTATFLRSAYGVAEGWGFTPICPLVWCKPSATREGGKFRSNIELCLFCRDHVNALAVAKAFGAAAASAGLDEYEVSRRMGVTRMALWWLGKAYGGTAARLPTWEQFQRLKQIIPIGDDFDEWIMGIDDARERRCSTRWWEWPRSEHSAKPEAFLDMVEQVSPGPYLELFARRARFGWDYWGDESLGTAEMPERVA